MVPEDEVAADESGKGKREHKLRDAALVAVLTAVIAGPTAPWWLHRFFSSKGSSSTTSSVSLASLPGTSVPSLPGTSVPSFTLPKLGFLSGVTTTIPTFPSSVCEVTVSAQGLETMHAEPDPSLQSGTKVPDGTYATIANRLVSFGGGESRWYEISVGGRDGWIEDDVFVSNTSSACPVS